MRTLTLFFFTIISFIQASGSNSLPSYTGMPNTNTHIKADLEEYRINRVDKEQNGIFQKIKKVFKTIRVLIKQTFKKRDRGHLIFKIYTGLSLIGLAYAIIVVAAIQGSNQRESLGAALAYLFLLASIIQTLIILFIWGIYYVVRNDLTEKDRKKKRRRRTHKKKSKKQNIQI